MSIDHLDGRIPFNWNIERLELNWSTGEKLELKEVHIRLAILPLLKRTLSFSYFNVSEAHYSFSHPPRDLTLDELKGKIKELGEGLSIPLRIAVQRLKIDTCLYENTFSQATTQFSLLAEGRMNKYMRQFQGSLWMRSLDTPGNYFEWNFEGHQDLNLGSTEMKASLAGDGGSFDFSTSLLGPWKSWHALLNNQEFSVPIQGKGRAHLHPVTIPLLNRLWTIDSHFSIENSHALSLQDVKMHSDLIELTAQGNLHAQLAESQGTIFFSLPDIAHFNPLTRGKLFGHVSYGDRKALLNFISEDLDVYGMPIKQLNALFAGSLHENTWEGKVDLRAENGLISSAEFVWQKDAHLSLQGLTFAAPGILVSGNLSMDLPTTLFAGNLYAQVDHLDRFSFLLPDELFDGSVGVDCQLSHEEGQQNVKLNTLGKNLLLRDYTIDELSLSATILNIFQQPLGSFYLSGERLRAPRFHLNTFNFNTASGEESNWDFLMETDGFFDGPLSCTARGSWQRDEQLFDLELTTLEGKISYLPFSMQYPCVFQQGANFCTLSPFHLNLHEGTLFTQFEFSPLRSTASANLQHFPLKLLECLSPKWQLEGSLSLNGFVDATTKNMQGALNMSLEEVCFLNSVKKDPVENEGDPTGTC